MCRNFWANENNSIRGGLIQELGHHDKYFQKLLQQWNKAKHILVWEVQGPIIQGCRKF